MVNQALTRWPRCPNCGRVPDGDQRLTRGEVMSEGWLKAHLKSCTMRVAVTREPTTKPKTRTRPKMNPVERIVKDRVKQAVNEVVKETLNDVLSAAFNPRRR